MATQSEAPRPRVSELIERVPFVSGSDVLRDARDLAWQALARLVSTVLDAPIATVSWCDGERLWFMGAVGLAEGVDHVPIGHAFCQRTLSANETTVFCDVLLQPAFERLYGGVPDFPRSYAGVPIRMPGTGQPIGTVAGADYVVREFSPRALAALEDIARQAESLLELRLEQRRLDAERRVLERTFDAAASGIYMTGRPGRADYGNPALERLFGLSVEQLVREWRERVHPEDAPIAQAWKTNALASPPVPMDTRLRHRDGHWVWTRNTVAPINGKDGSDGWVGTLVDTTHHKRLEDELRAADQRLNLAMAAGDQGIFDWNLETGECYFSDSWYRLFGLDRATTVADHMLWRQQVHPDDISTVQAAQAKHMQGRSASYDAEYRIRDGDGWRWVAARGRIAEHAPDGTPKRMRGMVHDIHARRLAEEQRRRFADRLELAETIAGMGHWVFDLTTLRLTISPNLYRLMGRDPALGPPSHAEFLAAIEPRDRVALDQAMTRAIANRSTWALEYRILRADGWHTMQARGRLRRTVDGDILEGTELDITELVQTREALRKASAAKADFLATMSHEIRTPLNGVLGMTELLRGTDLTSEQLAFVDVARASGEWLLALVSDVLDFSKIDGDHVAIDPRPFDVRALVEDVAGVVAEAAQKKGVELWLVVPPEVQEILLGDAQHIRQIVLNLTANAVKFTERGEVELRVALWHSEAAQTVDLEISVRDTGPGIAPEALGAIFEPFVQVGANPGRQKSGTGLGLAIAQRLALKMGGTVSASSKVGVGSTFALMLPLALAPEQPVPLRVPIGTRVTLFGAHAGSLAALRVMLDAAGADATVAEGMEGIDRSSTDVVVLDSNLGSLTTTLARALKARKLPVVLLSAVAERGAWPSTLFASVLVKPTRRRTLVEVIKKLASGEARVPTRPGLTPRQIFSGARVLVAEDNRINAFLLRTMLERAGCVVTVVEGGEAAIAAVRDGELDLVFMDCIMSDIDGYEATAAIRVHEATSAKPRVPIVAVTASAVEGDRERCLAAGMDDYVTKPITGESILLALERWIANADRTG